ncbi:MAG: NepR family anti-sigma factor [Pseudomonadota bacterium]
MGRSRNKVRTVSTMVDHGDDGPPLDGTGDPEALERQRVLGSRLKQIFDHVVDETVPDDLLDQLDQLDKGSAAPKRKNP